MLLSSLLTSPLQAEPDRSHPPRINFRGFSVVETTTAAKLGLIQPNVTPRTAPPHLPAHSSALEVTIHQGPNKNRITTALHAAGLFAFFNLKGLSFKHLKAVPPNLLVSINAWEIADGEARNEYTYWTP